MSRSRISRVEPEPLEPTWGTVDLSTHSGYPSAPYDSPYHDHTTFDLRNGESFPSPDISPPLQSQNWGGRRPPRVVSMVSPQSPEFSRTATSGPLGYSPTSISGGPRLSTLVSTSLPATLNPGAPATLTANRNSVSYSIPPPPAPPSLPPEFHDMNTSYDDFKGRFNEDEGSPGDRRSLTVPGMSKPGEKNIVRRISTKIISKVRGRPKSGWSYNSDTGDMIDEESLPTGVRSGGYAKVDGEGDEAIGVDLGFFTADHVPAAAVQAWQEHKMDADHLVYTGAGEAIDLSSFSGLDADKDSDTFSVHRAGNFEKKSQQSYYFMPNRDIPNWKPFSMRTWFLIFLLLLSLLLAVGAEVLLQFSGRGLIRKDKKQGILSFNSVNELNLVQFAVWKYMPTVVGVIYGILWKITDTEVKRAEPYYQLSRGSGGALAASTLNIEYQTFWSFLVPIAAIRHKQWVVVASSIASLVAFAIVPMFLSVFVKISPSQKERQSHLNGASIPKTIVVDIVFTRMLEATLVIVLIFGTYMLVALKRRRSGLLGDPSGIAGVAAMANKSHILMDFQNLDSASEEKIHKQLNKRTYLLHKGSLWQAHFLKESERDNQAPKAMNAHPLLLRLKGGIPFLLFLIVLTGLLPPMAYRTPLNSVVDKTPWVLTGLSVLIKSLWEIVEKDMRMLEPFWNLYKRHADSSVLTLDYSATVPGWLAVKALFKGHFLLAWVAVVSIMVEVLTVVMGSLDYNSGEESDTSFKVSFALAILILLILISTLSLVLHLRRQAFLPRQPGTISSILAFIHQSKMLIHFEGTEEATTAERRDKLAAVGLKYGFGWFRGRDGKRHLGIDYEEIIGSYKFGDTAHTGGVLEGDDVGGWDTYDRPSAR